MSYLIIYFFYLFIFFLVYSKTMTKFFLPLHKSMIFYYEWADYIINKP